ncbi:AAA domain-containing protein [Actinomadura gamaensis]|uniref:AAA domain-containing protein n=1 Tax=Actinomadura gamaensis TaxID=1763541 RepID=A0ABV9U1Y8_9ACTN
MGQVNSGATDAGRPEWLEEAVRAAEAQHRLLAGGGKGAKESTGDRCLGRAEPDAVRGHGWYEVAIRGERFDPDRLADAYLASESGAAERRYSLIEVVQDGAILRLRAGSHAPRYGLCFWVRDTGGSKLSEALLDGLRRMVPNRLAEDFALGRLAPVRMRADPPPGFNEQQRLAWSAGTARGLSVVWGPPGTGKTSVIARMIEDLLARGKTVLLVSGTNVAVDNALLKAATSLRPAPGTMLRVGPPAVPEVADDGRICLTRLQEAMLSELMQRAEAMSAEIEELRGRDEIREVEEAEQALSDFDPDAYQEAERRIRHRAEAERRANDVKGRERSCAQAEARLAQAVSAETSAHAAWSDTADSRAHLQAAAHLWDELSGRRLERDRAQAEAAHLQAEHQRLKIELDLHDRQPPVARLRARSHRRRLEAATDAAWSRWTVAADHARGIQDNLTAIEPELIRRMGAARASARYTEQEIERRRQEYEAAQRDVATARHELQHARGDLEQAKNSAHQAAAKPHPTPEDLDLVARADAEGLPALAERLSGLRLSANAVLQRLDVLEREHEKVMDEWRKLSRDAARKLVAAARVVATTLARLRINTDVHRRRYDHVIVDEVSASTPLEVLYALGLAEEGATLLGDFFQNGPIVLPQLQRSQDPAVRTWLQRDPFEAVGITGVARARGLPGCVVLTEQYRFGPAITALANAVAYEGLLQVASRTRDEIVLIDVDGLPEALAQVQRDGKSRKWAIGPLIARALAEHHLAQGESKVGVVTPYKPQRELTESVLADSGTSARVEVGTVHSFQGREFDTVILDLVEDGTGWMTRDSLGARRVFNVGATRARHRLYVVVNSAVVHRGGGVLRKLREVLEAGAVTVVRAADLLGLHEEEAPGEGPAHEVWDALRTYVKVIDLYDEERLPAELIRRIEQAESSIWLWSPWAATRVAEFLPPLRAAVDRGVRVRVIMLPDWDLKGTRFEPFAERVTAALPDVIFMRNQHQKIVVIDQRLVLLGSMNLLSHRRSRGRREIMALFESRSLARHVLEHERADALSRPPTCPECGRRAEIELRGSGMKRRLHWLCGGTKGRPDHWRLPLPDVPGGRNQRRS